MDTYLVSAGQAVMRSTYLRLAIYGALAAIAGITVLWTIPADIAGILGASTAFIGLVSSLEFSNRFINIGKPQFNRMQVNSAIPPAIQPQLRGFFKAYQRVSALRSASNHNALMAGQRFVFHCITEGKVDEERARQVVAELYQAYRSALAMKKSSGGV